MVVTPSSWPKNSSTNYQLASK